MKSETGKKKLELPCPAKSLPGHIVSSQRKVILSGVSDTFNQERDKQRQLHSCQDKPFLFVPPQVGWHVDWPIDEFILVFSIMNASNFNASGLLMKSFWRFLNSGWFVKMLHICGFSPQAWAPSPPAVTSQECVSQDTEWGNISEAVIRLFKQLKLLFKLKVNKLV